MSTISSLTPAVMGVQRGLAAIQRDAHTIASATQPGNLAEITTPLVELKHYELQVAAAMKVARATDSMLGSLIDTEA